MSMASPSGWSTCRAALFYWAVVLAVATVPLLAAGGLVTSTGSGMADPDWQFTPFKLLTPAGWAEMGANVALMIEHSHRQLGFIVGMLAIGLAVGCGWCLRGPRRWLGLAVLAAVSGQGALGAFRITLHAWFGAQFALLHGIFGQLVFVLIVTTAVLLSPRWERGERVEEARPGKLRRLSLLLFVMAVLQLVSGAALRHLGGDLLLAVHLFLALAVASHVVLVWGHSLTHLSNLVRNPAQWTMALLALQLLLGFGAWWAGGGQPVVEARELTQARIALTTSHQTLGALLLAATSITALRCWRHLPAAARDRSDRALEAVS
jgi:hypothetical protein